MLIVTDALIAVWFSYRNTWKISMNIEENPKPEACENQGSRSPSLHIPSFSLVTMVILSELPACDIAI